MAVGIYFGLRPLVGSEEVGWMCILGAAPFAACGFFKYHGMTAEKLAWAWFKSEFLYPKKLVFQSESLYYEAMKDAIAEGAARLTTPKRMSAAAMTAASVYAAVFAMSLPMPAPCRRSSARRTRAKEPFGPSRYFIYFSIRAEKMQLYFVK